MRRYSIFGIIIYCMSLMALGGCATVKVPYKDEDHAWAAHNGHATVVVQASAIFGNRRYYCASFVKESFLLPDTPYYRDWIRVLKSPYNFKGDINKKAQALLRKAPWEPVCTFVFKDVPVGKWIFLGNVQYYLLKKEVSWGGRVPILVDTSLPNLLWGSISVEDNADLVARQVVQNGNRRKDIGMFKVRNYGAEADVEVWSLTEEGRKKLGVAVQAEPQGAGAK